MAGSMFSEREKSRERSFSSRLGRSFVRSTNKPPATQASSKSSPFSFAHEKRSPIPHGNSPYIDSEQRK